MTKIGTKCPGWVAAFVLLAAGQGLAAPPKLEAKGDPVPRSARTGEKYTFQIEYSDPDGDRPQRAMLVTEGPEGRQSWPAQPFQAGAAARRRGVMLDFVAGPFSGGQHRAHFEVATVDGQDRYPDRGVALEFTVENVLLKWIQLLVGLAVALLFLPLIMFVLVRSVNPRSDPTRAARFGLLVGIVASYALFVYLFSALYSLPLLVLLGVVALGAMFALVPRRA